MASELPEQIDCRQLAAGDGRLTGVIGRARLARVASPYRLAGDLAATVDVAPRAGGGYTVSGRLEVALEAQCQRCLEWMNWPVNATLDVVAVDRPLAAHEEEEDWLELADGMLPLREVLEDELLLSCPYAPLHEAADCAGEVARESGETPAPADRRRPFANLGEMLKSRERE